MARSAHTDGVDAHDLKRREIVAAAAAVFDERGFTAGTTKDVAARVGLSQPSIYHYVGSKDTLLCEIAAQVDTEMLEALERGTRKGTTASEKLRAVIHEFTAAVVENALHFSVYYKERHVLPDELVKEIVAHERQFVGGVAAIVATLQAEGRLPDDRPTTVLTEGIIGMVSWVHRWYRPGGRLDAASIADVFCEMLAL